MNPQLTKFVEQARLDSQRHDEMLESLVALHGRETAVAVAALHQQYRIAAADMLAVAPMLSEPMLSLYVQTHQNSYAAVVSLLLEAVMGEKKWKIEGHGVVSLLARMNNDSLSVMRAARESPAEDDDGPIH